MQRSRRLLFVLSPDFVVEKSFGLLECRLALYLQQARQAAIVAVVRRSVSRLPCVEVARLRQGAVSTVTWRGVRSEPPTSRFWLRLRLALPLRPLALGRRLIDSTSSHSDLAALALQKVHQNQNQDQTQNQSNSHQRHRTNQSRRSRLTAANQSCRDRRVLPRERKEGTQHSRRCSGCAGFRGQAQDRGAELIVQTERGQESHDPNPETDSTPVPDSAPDGHHTQRHAPSPDMDSDSTHSDVQQEDAGKHNQLLIGPRTSEAILSPRKGEGLVVKVAIEEKDEVKTVRLLQVLQVACRLQDKLREYFISSSVQGRP